MDKEEAERLVKTIHLTRMDWIQVQELLYDRTKQHYEVKCSYKQKREPRETNESWTTLLITSPRQWIKLLAQRGGGLELP